MGLSPDPVSQGIALGTDLLKIGLAQLVAHSARLKGAKTENAGIAPVVQAFDQDVQTIVTAYNNGQADAATCAQAARTVAANIKANLQNNAAPGSRPLPGAAWSDSTGLTGNCDKTCTAGCCVYYGDLGPVLSMMSYALGGGAIIPQWGPNDPRYHATASGATIDVPEVFASKYGGTDRPGYQITLARSGNPVAVLDGIQNTVAEMLGLGATTSGGAAVESLAGGGAPPSGGSSTLLIAAVLAVVLAFALLLKK